VLGELKMAKVLVFDETLLVLGSLREPFAWDFGDAHLAGRVVRPAAPAHWLRR